MNHRRWKLLPNAPAGYLKQIGLTPLAAQLLYNRGIDGLAEAEAFLNKAEDLQNDPFLLPDMDRAVARVYQALLRGETIAVYGDFDADGICGTVLLIRGLSLLGGKAIPYIPHRVQEGYGLNVTALESLVREGVTLVITVDCGISDIPQVKQAQQKGLDIIITDHHSISHGLPPALAVINPKRTDSIYPFSQLAGVGVAFKLLQALYQILGKREMLDEMLDLVSVGTVADMVPLLGENRYLVVKGLRVLNRTRRVGLQEMLCAAGLGSKDVDSEAISWIIAPRLNAPGRLDHALAGYRLLVTDSAEEARQLAQELEETNAQRQRLTSELFVKAKEQLSAAGTDFPLLMVAGADYRRGVVGLVAGKLVEEFYRPSLVLEMGDEVSTGSARSISEFDIIAALAECRHMLLRFGGHPMAAGLALYNRDLPQFQQRLLEVASQRLAAADLCPTLAVEAEVPLSSINGGVLKFAEKLAPFGTGNPQPVFLSRGVRVLDRSIVGNGSQHLRLRLKQGGVVWRAIGFDMGHLLAEVAPEVDIVYKFSVDRWGGQEMVELSLLDFAPVR
ncbi:MAG: single-stranded-DNA-specific exonuclease RecJ [Chloroflexi bacterium]|nr:single-stranded-DNA-specific exonuclease RecJ [Chloroflexota bacterium]